MKITWKTGLGISFKSILLLVVGLAVVVGAYLLAVRPLESSLAEDRQKLESIEAQAQVTQERLTELREAGPNAIFDLEARLQTSKSMLPGTLDPVALVNVLAPAARNYQVDLQLSFDGATPTPTPGQPYSVVLQGTATGSQQAITSWLIGMQSSRPLITVSAFSVSSLDGQAVANVQLTVWGYGEATTVIPDPAATATNPAVTPAPVDPTPVTPAPTAPATPTQPATPAPTQPVVPVPAPTAPVPVITPSAPAPSGP